jgi:hypothetical protein
MFADGVQELAVKTGEDHWMTQAQDQTDSGTWVKKEP